MEQAEFLCRNHVDTLDGLRSSAHPTSIFLAAVIEQS
jgi:hypothetical protein